MTVPGPHRFALTVYYEDTDLGGIVYYANYLRFIERGRTEALEALGIDQVALKDEAGIVFVVRRVEADYLAPARFRDRLDVYTSLRALGGTRIDLAQSVLRAGVALMRAEVRLVAVGPDLRPIRVPEAVRAALARMGAAADAP